MEEWLKIRVKTEIEAEHKDKKEYFVENFWRLLLLMNPFLMSCKVFGKHAIPTNRAVGQCCRFVLVIVGLTYGFLFSLILRKFTNLILGVAVGALNFENVFFISDFLNLW